MIRRSAGRLASMTHAGASESAHETSPGTAAEGAADDGAWTPAADHEPSSKAGDAWSAEFDEAPKEDSLLPPSD
jgi:hypothetical protein